MIDGFGWTMCSCEEEEEKKKKKEPGREINETICGRSRQKQRPSLRACARWEPPKFPP